MLIRRLVVLIGLLTAAVGTVQILARHKMEDVSRNLLCGNLLFAFAGFAVLVGVVLIWSAALKLVRIRRFVLGIGLLSLASGLFMMAAPAFARDLANSLYFNRAESYRVVTAFAAGLLRVVFGALLAYSGLRPPSPRTPRLGSIVPLA